MKKTTAMGLVLLMSCPILSMYAAAEAIPADQVVIGDDVHYVTAVARDGVEFEDEDGGTELAQELFIAFSGADVSAKAPEDLTDADAVEAYEQQVHDELWNNLNLGSLYVYKFSDEEGIRYMYEGIATDDIGDTEYCDYDSYYPVTEEKQIRYIDYAPDNSRVIFIKYFNTESSVHDALRVEWTETEDGSGTWKIDRFDCDTVETPDEAVMAARFHFWDNTSFEVVTESGRLNIRQTPGGEIIEQLEKGTDLTIYRHEEPAEDGMRFTLVAKYTEPDEDGWRYLEYYGWAATQYLQKQEDYLWVLDGGEANDRAEEKWNAIMEGEE